jgi:hypothetical protein
MRKSLGRNTSVDVNRVAAVLLVGFVRSRARLHQIPSSSERPKALSAEEAAVLGDSIKALVATRWGRIDSS